MRLSVLCLALALSFAANAAGPRVDFGEPNRSVEDVSLVALIATPEKYAGKAVRVVGAFRLEFEGNDLCLSKADLDHYITKNCVWLELDSKTLGPKSREIAGLNGQFVLVEGIFSSKEKGHMGMNSGAVTGIWRVMSVERVR